MSLEERLEDALAEADIATALLCTVMNECGPITRDTLLNNVTGLWKWWDEHQRRDKNRLIAEALSKLTLKERMALGFD